MTLVWKELGGLMDDIMDNGAFIRIKGGKIMPKDDLMGYPMVALGLDLLLLLEQISTGDF